MKPDDQLCYCFHVPLRKVINFLRVHRPSVASQLSECGGAGTGCGWCVPYLKRLFEASRQQQDTPAIPISPDQYAKDRAAYVRSGRGKPPAGAEPLPPAE